MSSRPAVACSLGLWLGVTLVMAEFRWGRHLPLAKRLAPYATGRPVGPESHDQRGPPLLAVALPLATVVGTLVDRALGVPEGLALRLARTRSPLDPAGHRLRQLASGLGAFGVGIAAISVLTPPPALSLLALAAAAMLGVLLPERQLSAASTRRQRQVEQELPLIIEQLASMVDAGLSTQTALQRIADRGTGACHEGFADVCARVRQGLSETQALQEWAELAGVDGARRLSELLTLPAPDLGRLLETEAHQLRRESHRRLVESIERRAQQVWIPVTVATLVPGVLFLAVPFIEAMRLFSAA